MVMVIVAPVALALPIATDATLVVEGEESPKVVILVFDDKVVSLQATPNAVRAESEAETASTTFAFTV
jgi:hypothetical protein